MSQNRKILKCNDHSELSNVFVHKAQIQNVPNFYNQIDEVSNENNENSNVDEIDHNQGQSEKQQSDRTQSDKKLNEKLTHIEGEINFTDNHHQLVAEIEIHNNEEQNNETEGLNDSLIDDDHIQFHRSPRRLDDVDMIEKLQKHKFQDDNDQLSQPHSVEEILGRIPKEYFRKEAKYESIDAVLDHISQKREEFMETLKSSPGNKHNISRTIEPMIN